MKKLYYGLLILLAIALLGLGITAIVKSEVSLMRGERAIASADEFLRRYGK